MKNKEKKRLSFPWFLLPIGLMVLGVFLIVDHYNFENNAVETTAQITKIEYVDTVDADGKPDSNRVVYVSFTVDGIEYTGALDSNNSFMKEGMETRVFYDKDNPSNFRNSGVINYILGGFFILLGPAIFALLVRMRKSR